MRAELPPPTFDGREVGEQIDRILVRPEFREPPEPLLNRILGWVGEQISRVVGALAGGGRGALVAWALLIAGAVALGLVLYRIAASSRVDRRVRPPGAADQVGRPPEDWRAEAAAHEARGEWRQALRCRYRALVADLAARGLVDEVPGRTAGEYRREVATNLPAASDAFGGATQLFELAWYGHRPTDADEIDRFRSLSEQVLAGART